MLPPWFHMPSRAYRTEDDPGPVEQAQLYTYACLDCGWRGRWAWFHHRKQHHRIRILNGPEQVFPCCKETPR